MILFIIIEQYEGNLNLTLLIVFPISLLIFSSLYVSLMRGFQSFAIKCYPVIDLFKSCRNPDFILINAKVTTVERWVIVAIWLSTKLNESVWIIYSYSLTASIVSVCAHRAEIHSTDVWERDKHVFHSCCCFARLSTHFLHRQKKDVLFGDHPDAGLLQFTFSTYNN